MEGGGDGDEPAGQSCNAPPIIRLYVHRVEQSKRATARCHDVEVDGMSGAEHSVDGFVTVRFARGGGATKPLSFLTC
jgi:hypothetical protein